MAYEAPKGGFRTFLIVWASQSVSVFGSALTGFAINIWLVQTVYPLPEQRPQLAWALAAMGLAGALPAIAFTPVAGALADRLDRKRLMIAMDIVSGVLTGAMALLMAAGRLNIWLLFATFAVSALASAAHGSAFDASYAMLVTDAQLPRANGLMQTMWSLSSLLSPAAAAALIAAGGAYLAVMIDAATFFLAAAVLAPLFVPSPKRADLSGAKAARPSVWADVRFGLTFLWRRRPLLWLLVLFSVVNLCMPFGVFLPLVVKVDLAADWAAKGFTYEGALAAINTVFSLGGVAGGFFISAWGGVKRNRVIVLMGAILVGAVSQIAIGLSPSLYLALGVAFLFTFTAPIGNAHSQAIWQMQVPRELQGRVFGIRRLIGRALSPLGTVLAGWLAGIINPGAGLALLGGIIILVVAVGLLSPVIRRVEDTEYLERLGATAD